MKTATIYAVIAIVASFGTTAFGQPACNGNAGQPAVGPVDLFPPLPNDIFFPPVDQIPPALTPGTSATPGVRPSAPPVTQLRITPLNSAPTAAPAAPSARVSLVPAPPATKPQTTDVTTETPSNKPATTAPEEDNTIAPALAGLVGAWSTPARFGDGELTTVELQLDDRGWAELTVPAADGKRSTIKRRVSLEDKELKLSAPDEQTISLGKLIEFDSRQFVLERTGRQFTFVRRST